MRLGYIEAVVCGTAAPAARLREVLEACVARVSIRDAPLVPSLRRALMRCELAGVLAVSSELRALDVRVVLALLALAACEGPPLAIAPAAPDGRPDPRLGLYRPEFLSLLPQAAARPDARVELLRDALARGDAWLIPSADLTSLGWFPPAR